MKLGLLVSFTYMGFLLQDVGLLNCKNVQDGSQGSLVSPPLQTVKAACCVLWVVGWGHSDVGWALELVLWALGQGCRILGFLGPLIQMPGTRGVLIPCVCVIPHCLMLVPFVAWILLGGPLLLYPADGIVGVHGLAVPYVYSVQQVSLNSLSFCAACGPGCLVQRGLATVSQSYKSEHQVARLSTCTVQTIPTVTDLHTKQS